jgi:hypothetical protein
MDLTRKGGSKGKGGLSDTRKFGVSVQRVRIPPGQSEDPPARPCTRKRPELCFKSWMPIRRAASRLCVTELHDVYFCDTFAPARC